jgi:Sec-independent protein secretion pathway component TatC|uniref:Sec-independent translocase component C n=1 Tax=Cyanidiaceae sp. MX-AZ01 TaxID=1503164 RepID=A0A060AE17_9RHOD|nr:Sec-independent translocase component C [Cyanidiaceae sp. MX-AZ01]
MFINKPVNLYLKELKHSCYYFFFSLLFCIIIISYKINTILFFIITSLPRKELIATEIYEIFLSYLIIIVNFSFLFCYPLLVHNLFSFFCNAWTKEEKRIFLQWLLIMIYFLFNNLIFTYIFLIPLLSLFFYTLEQMNNNFIIYYEIKINNFVYWFFNNLLSFTNMYIFPLSLIVFVKSYQMVKLLKIQRRYFILLNLILSLFLSFDLISQILILTLLCINYEIFIFIIIINKIKIIKNIIQAPLKNERFQKLVQS